MYWLTTDGDASMAEGTLVVHSVIERSDGNGPEPFAAALCGETPASRRGWYGDYDERDGGPPCRACNREHRRLTGLP